MKAEYLAMREKYPQPEIMYSFEYIHTILRERLNNRRLVNYSVICYVVLNNVITLTEIRNAMEHAGINQHAINERIDEIRYVLSNLKNYD